ncbi:hypothetical protein N8633_01125 [bacterium]|nr:hypothetical protein [bacterium]
MTPDSRYFKLAGFLSLSLMGTLSLSAQTIQFDEGTDEGWTRFSALDVVGVSSIISFPNDQSGGKAYRLQSPAPPVPDAGPARTFVYQEESHTDFYAAVDIIEWNNDVNQAFGLFFRATNIGLGQTLGYVLNYDPQQGSGARGQIQFNIVTGEAASGTIGAANLSFEPGHSYRIVMRAEGALFNADVYDLNDLTSPLTSYHGTDETYAAGAVGLFNFYRGDEVTDPDLGIADTVFDNYTVAAGQDSVPAPGAWRGLEGWPHILSLTPLNRSTFHNPTDGIRFSVSTLDGNPLDQSRVKLALNGTDVTSQLKITPVDSNLNIASAGLAPNTVYDAKIEITSEAGTSAMTEWTFDTFSEDYLSSNAVEIIELEDYNFDEGKFLDTPPVSGFKENGSGVNANEGYVDREGVAGIDFFDYESTPAGEEKAIYRSFDPVATQAGASEAGSDEQFSGPDPAVNDTVRSVYTDAGLTEIQVTNTEGGEWLNYTREFTEGDYAVYLRGAGRATQSIHLDEVTSNPSDPDQTTDRLGTFTLPNMGMEYNYRFVPLLDDAGSPVTLSLSGTKTLRVSIGSEQENRTNETTALNYLAFVPAPEPPSNTLTVAVSNEVTGTFTADPGIQVSGNEITLPITGTQRFLSITAGGTPVSVSSVELLDGSMRILLDL